MDRIYYFDVPVVYQALTDRYPALIPIRQFGSFFTERSLTAGRGQNCDPLGLALNVVAAGH